MFVIPQCLGPMLCMEEMLKYLSWVENRREMPSCWSRGRAACPGPDGLALQPPVLDSSCQDLRFPPTPTLIPTNHSGPDVKVISSLPL